MKEVTSYLIDTNILLRFLRNDHLVFSPASRKLFERSSAGKLMLEIPFIAIVETFQVLHSRYKMDRTVVAREMTKIVNAAGVRLSAPEWISDAIAEYSIRKVSFGDACIAAEARASGKIVASFDRDFDSFEGIVRFEPK